MGAGISLFLVSADDCFSPNSLSLIVEDGKVSALGDRNFTILSISFLRRNSRMYSKKNEGEILERRKYNFRKIRRILFALGC